MGRPTHLIILLCFLFFFSSLVDHQIRHAAAQKATALNVGVVLDLGSLPGKKNWVSISMAVDEFYAVSGNLSKRVVLHPSDSQGDIVGAALAAQDLLRSVKAQAIIGPFLSSQTEFIANLGNKTQVPAISFSDTSPSLSSILTPYFVRATLDDSSQAGAIAAIFGLYQWREVALAYEDTDYGSGIILFRQARTAGLMSPGYVWLASDGLTNVLDPIDPTTINSTEGLLCVRAHVPQSSLLASFNGRWQARFSRDNPTVTTRADPTVHHLRAFDVAWAFALAVNKTGKFETGPALLRAIRSTQFRGLAGDLRLVDGQLQLSSGFEIVNVIGKGGRAVGFWTPEVGIRKELNDSSDAGLKPVDVETDNVTGVTKITRYYIDVIDTVVDALPYLVPYEYTPYIAESSDDLVSQVYLQRFDAVVGNATNRKSLRTSVDFTLPHGDSVMVPVTKKKKKSLRRFGGLFLITGCASTLALLCFLIAFVCKEWDDLKTLVFQSSCWKRMVGSARRSNSHGRSANYANGGSRGGSNDSNLTENPDDSLDVNDGSSNGGRPTELGELAAQHCTMEITELRDG